jgi:2'-5' RNA ligase
LRLFFALWPDAATRRMLDSLAREVAVETGGRAVAADNLHLTLAFLGERPAAIVPELFASAEAIEGLPFRLSLDDVGCWRKTGIAWLAASKHAAQLQELRQRHVWRGDANPSLRGHSRRRSNGKSARSRSLPRPSTLAACATKSCAILP